MFEQKLTLELKQSSRSEIFYIYNNELVQIVNDPF